MASETDLDDLHERLDSVGLLNVRRAHQELKDCSDQELVQLIYAYGGEDETISEQSSLTSYSLAIFMLRERGYTVDGDFDDPEIRDPDGELVTPSFK